MKFRHINQFGEGGKGKNMPDCFIAACCRFAVPFRIFCPAPGFIVVFVTPPLERARWLCRTGVISFRQICPSPLSVSIKTECSGLFAILTTTSEGNQRLPKFRETTIRQAAGAKVRAKKVPEYIRNIRLFAPARFHRFLARFSIHQLTVVRAVLVPMALYLLRRANQSFTNRVPSKLPNRFRQVLNTKKPGSKLPETVY